MLFIHVIIAYYTFAAAGHEAPLSPLFSLKKYLNLKKGRWLRSEKVREGFSVNRVNERVSSEASTNESSFFFLSHIQLLSLILRTIATQKKRKKILWSKNLGVNVCDGFSYFSDFMENKINSFLSLESLSE